MEVSLQQFVERLTGSGLMTDDELRASLPELPDSAEQLAAALVQRECITGYQSQVLLDKRQGPLVVGNYVVLEQIGVGGMGQVYKALHRRMERIVAIKVLPGSATNSEKDVRRERNRDPSIHYAAWQETRPRLHDHWRQNPRDVA